MKSKLYNQLLLAGGIMAPLWAEAAGSQPKNPVATWIFENILLFICLIVLFFIGILLWRLIDTMTIYHRDTILKEQGITPPKVSEPDEFSFEKLYKKAWSLVPMDKESDIDLGHDYDGIRELDNSLPPWWLYLFYITIFFAGVYLYIYQFSGIGKSSAEEYAAEMEIAEDQQRRYLASQANAIDETSVVTLTDAASLADGQQLFIANCAACHGNEGQGGVGPNFCDKYWIHGGDVKDIFKTIKYGVPEKGMVPWKAQLKPASIQKLASYILTLEGTNPPNQKEPQGELYTRK